MPNQTGITGIPYFVLIVGDAMSKCRFSCVLGGVGCSAADAGSAADGIGSAAAAIILRSSPFPSTAGSAGLRKGPGLATRPSNSEP